MASPSQIGNFYGSGFAFPVTFEPANGEVRLVHQQTTINQAIDIVLSTRIGDRSLQPNFGSPLSRFTFRKFDSTLEGEIVEAVRSTLLENEPRISVEKVLVAVQSDNAMQISVVIDYRIKTTNTRHNHVYPFSLVEGTNLVDGQ